MSSERLQHWSTCRIEGIERLRRSFSFADFRQALAFANAVGELAEQHNHHPALRVEWGKVTVDWWSHDVGGISERDRQMAAATDLLHA